MPSSDRSVFARRYLAHADAQLSGRSAAELADLARCNEEFGALRPDGATLVRVRDIDADTTVIDIVTDDTPYLVESVRAELRRRGTPALQILHPQLVVRRDAAGALAEVLDLDDTAQVPEGVSVESWMYIEIDDVPVAAQGELEADLRRVLTDVHLAVADAPGMYRTLRELAEQLQADPGEFDRDSSSEAGELLRWLADGNYLALGHTAYSANELAGAQARINDADAQGVLRGAARISPLELLPALRSGMPLVIFKSPLVSTVRRSAHYDCVTVVTPAGPGRQQMVHVFLGLITDA